MQCVSKPQAKPSVSEEDWADWLNALTDEHKVDWAKVDMAASSKKHGWILRTWWRQADADSCYSGCRRYCSSWGTGRLCVCGSVDLVLLLELMANACSCFEVEVS